VQKLHYKGQLMDCPVLDALSPGFQVALRQLVAI
jgi:hypothetical protein